LAGLRVIDMTLMLAGPYASMLLADHGAEVIKVEPLEGDYVRTVGPYRPDDSLHAFGGYFQSVNRNKLSIALNLKEPEARDILIEMVKHADVLVENYRTGVMDRLGLSYETLHAVNPRLVYAAVRGSATAQRQQPLRELAGYDVIAQAMGGIMESPASPRRSRRRSDPAWATSSPRSCAPSACSRRSTGEGDGTGQFVDVSMVDSVLALCERIVYQYSYEQKVPKPEGQRHPFLTPFGIVPCKDGHITLACHTDALWAKLCKLISRPEMATDPRLTTEAARREHSDLVYGIVSEFTLQRTKSELLVELGGQVPFSPVYTVAEIAKDPHFAARNMLVELEHPGASGRMAVAGVPVKMSETLAVSGGARHCCRSTPSSCSRRSASARNRCNRCVSGGGRLNTARRRSMSQKRKCLGASSSPSRARTRR
jgi:crotonobetainyl-CoA:carnitine CoA-transferase CaiB-like acyl-CoA transferase